MSPNDYCGPERRQYAREIPLRPWWRKLLCRAWSLIAYSDTTPTRFMLALTATIIVLFLSEPGDTFTRPIYYHLQEIAGQHAEVKWAVVWSVYAVGMWWRTFSSKPSLYWALLFNSLGLALFGSTAIAILVSRVYPLPMAVTPFLVMTLSAFWVLVRTHINSEHGWRID